MADIPFLAMPTTAGTGSEATRYAVIYYDGKKQSVTHDSVVPDVAILEPKVLKTLPLYQKKCTMMDALCQGIESWWSMNSTDESKAREKMEKLLSKNGECISFEGKQIPLSLYGSIVRLGRNTMHYSELFTALWESIEASK